MDQAAESGTPETLEEHLARGGDRRSFIKKMAVAGAAAWVAPIVAGSFVSPAMASGAALSVQYTKRNPGADSICNAAATTTTGGTCDPAGFTAGQVTATNITALGIVTTDCSFASTSFTVGAGHTISAGTRCRGGTSSAGVLSNSNMTITFTGNVTGDVFRFVAT